MKRNGKNPRSQRGPKKEWTPIEMIQHVLSKQPNGISVRELLKRSRVRSKPLFFAALQQLEQQGTATINKRHQVFLTTTPSQTLAGKVQSLSETYAFVRPDDGGKDIFVSGNHLRGAIIGDKVTLRNITDTPRGKKGEIAEITQASQRSTTGTLVKNEDGYEVIPDASIRYNLPVVKRGSIEAQPGDKVQVELIESSRSDGLLARITKVYGTGERAKICADAIIDQYEIPTIFPEPVLTQAANAAAMPITEQELAGRLDLRKEMICTIDGADAKDLDDAIHVRSTETGFELGVHIADVSHYVTQGSAIDEEAIGRGTSVYFADRVIPMLPTDLSNGACSLNAGTDKLTFSAIIQLGKDGAIQSYEFHKSVISSKVRGVYSEVNQLFDKTASPELIKKYKPVSESLTAARSLAAVLRKRSRSKGTMDFASDESMFVLDADGVCVDVMPRTHGEAEGTIEQLMIAANQAAAMLAREAEMPFIYRTHSDPDPDRVAMLISLATALGFSAPQLTKEKLTPADFSKLLKQVKGTPAERAISYQMLRSMDKAKYSPDPLGHFGLSLDDYCHFTSPIRRYPDLAIHRILSSAQTMKKGELDKFYSAFVKEASTSSSQCEVRAMSAEREAEKCYMAEFMKGHIGEEFDGMISGVTQRGIFVQLANSAEGFVPISDFPDDNYQFDGLIAQVDETTGKKLTIGDPLRIRVASAEIPTGRIDFTPVG